MPESINTQLPSDDDSAAELVSHNTPHPICRQEVVLSK